jgi:TPR repeat protein
MYRAGEGVEKKDMKKAADLFRKAHEKGHAEATYMLGMM